MNLWLNVRLALRSIWGNLLRTVLTFLIIAFGMTALVGILTSIDVIEGSLVSKLSRMGSNSFNIRTGGMGMRSSGSERKVYPPIDYEDAANFIENFDYPATVSLSTRASSGATLKYQYEKTNPNVGVMGVNGSYFDVSGYEFFTGRNFSAHELMTGSNVVILGADVVSMLFSPRDTIENKVIRIGNLRYRVVGALTSKGASLISSDNMVFIPQQNARNSFDAERFVLTIKVSNPELLNQAEEEATGVFRVVRGLGPGEENDFNISRSDKLANTVIDQLKYIRWATIVIAIVTLLGAGVGLMNIMLVSVAERTREIGISKAIGANNTVVRTQFLTEAIVICQIGGVLGIVFGVIAGNLLALLFEAPFIIPWNWMGMGFSFCFLVGLAAGFYPALKASRLDPIEALRYE